MEKKVYIMLAIGLVAVALLGSSIAITGNAIKKQPFLISIFSKEKPKNHYDLSGFQAFNDYVDDNIAMMDLDQLKDIIKLQGDLIAINSALLNEILNEDEITVNPEEQSMAGCAQCQAGCSNTFTHEVEDEEEQIEAYEACMDECSPPCP